MKTALRGATINKLIFALFTTGGAVFPFLLYRLSQDSLSSNLGVSVIVGIDLRVAVSLSILLVFGYIVLYSIQVLPSFVSSGSFSPLAQLPLNPGETSEVAFLTLWRTLDYVLVMSLLVQFATVAYVTGSVLAAGIVLLTTASGSILAVAAALWLTSVFQRRLEGRRMAGLRGLFRPLLFILWGLGVMSAVFIFSLVSYLAPPLNALLTNPGTPLGFLASLTFPFSAGILVSSISGEVVTRLGVISSASGILLALVGSAVASFGAYRIINRVILPGRQVSGESRKVDYNFGIHSALSAYIMKDFRVSSRNPATGFLFALPIFEILAVVLPLTSTPKVRMSEILAISQTGGGFALFIAFLLVTVEDLGVERMVALPIKEAIRTLSKVIISTVSYVPVVCALAVILFTKPSTFDGALIVPLAALGSVFAACVVEVVVLRALTVRGFGAAVRFAVGVGSGECILIAPAIVYTFEYVLSRGHAVSIEGLAAVSLAELVLAAVVLVVTRRQPQPPSDLPHLRSPDPDRL